MVTKKYLQARVSQLERKLAEVEEERDHLRTEMMSNGEERLRAQLAEARGSQERLEREKEQLQREAVDLRRELDDQRARLESEMREAALVAELAQYRAVEKSP